MSDVELDFSMWGVLLAVALIAPLVFYAVKLYADRRRDRLTRELIAAEERAEGKVPDLPADFMTPQVIPREKVRIGGRRPRSPF